MLSHGRGALDTLINIQRAFLNRDEQMAWLVSRHKPARKKESAALLSHRAKKKPERHCGGGNNGAPRRAAALLLMGSCNIMAS